MRTLESKTLRLIATLLAGLLIAKVTIEVVSNYVNYVPPNFGSDFLRGRERDFLGPYPWAFYIHIASGPFALLLGMILVSERFRRRFPAWHRRLGRIYAIGVLFLVAPSGLWMAYYAAAGPIGGLGLAALAFATAISVALGWRAAVLRRFVEHRRWMWRTFLLLSSAVVLRMIGGLASVTGFAPFWLDPMATWVSWLLPIIAFEWSERAKVSDQSSRLAALSSFPEIEIKARR